MPQSAVAKASERSEGRKAHASTSKAHSLPGSTLQRRDDTNVTFNSCVQESHRNITRSDVPTERRGKRQQELQSGQGRCGREKFVAVVHLFGVAAHDHATPQTAVALPHLDPTSRNGFGKCFLSETRLGNLVEHIKVLPATSPLYGSSVSYQTCEFSKVFAVKSSRSSWLTWTGTSKSDFVVAAATRKSHIGNVLFFLSNVKLAMRCTLEVLISKVSMLRLVGEEGSASSSRGRKAGVSKRPASVLERAKAELAASPAASAEGKSSSMASCSSLSLRKVHA